MLLLNWHVLFSLVFAAQAFKSANAAVGNINVGLITFPAQACSCTNLFCTCCQNIVVNMANMSKTLCLLFKASLSDVSIDVTIQLDRNTVAQFTLSAETPPIYCIPVITQTLLAMCVAFHDISVIGYNNLKVCSTIYASFISNQIFSFNFPCVELTPNGLTLMQ